MSEACRVIQLFSRCVFDVDNRYVDLIIRRTSMKNLLALTMSDTSNYEEYNAEIELYLTTEELGILIERLNGALNLLVKELKDED